MQTQRRRLDQDRARIISYGRLCELAAMYQYSLEGSAGYWHFFNVWPTELCSSTHTIHIVSPMANMGPRNGTTAQCINNKEFWMTLIPA